LIPFTIALVSVRQFVGDPEHASDPLGSTPSALSETHRIPSRGMHAQLLHSGIEAHASAFPHDTAVIAGDVRLSFGELNARANEVAGCLADAGVCRSRRVAVVMKKGWEQVVGVLAILKAGGAYVPLDGDLPPLRLRQMLDLVEAPVALTQTALASDLDFGPAIRCLAVDEGTGAADFPAGAADVAPADLAYVIFTSGSTGIPKGVMVTHEAAMTTIRDVNRRFGLQRGDRVLGLSSLSFDLSVWDLFGVLGCGGAVVLPDVAADRDPRVWAQLVREHSVTVWNSVPMFLEMLVDYLNDDRRSLGSSLRLVLLSGDWIPIKLPSRFRELVPSARLVSLGGATEAAIWSIFYEIGDVDPSWDSIPYGRALTDQTVEVLDNDLRQLPPCLPGDLYIGGRSLALGYFKAPDLTHAAFVVNERTSERLYRTGDRGRLLPDGNIQFLGREDKQVKIGGFRVELGEIEAALQQHPSVRLAVVTTAGHPRQPTSLAAYLASDSKRLNGEELNAFLAERLPRYMIPSTFTILRQLPLTENGKVDRHELLTIFPPERLRDPPKSPFEKMVARTWETVLGRSKIGRDVNFFQLGGDSLRMTRVAVALREKLGYEPPLELLFAKPTIAELAAALERYHELDNDEKEHSLPAAIRADSKGPESGPLSFGQEQVWFLERLGSPNLAYQFQCTVELRGDLNVAFLERALSEVVRRHEILRTTFEERNSEPVQNVHEPFDVKLEVVDLADLPIKERTARELEVLRDFFSVRLDVGVLPLIKWKVIRRAADEFAIAEVEHHFVHDGWSVGVLWGEVSEIYSAMMEGRKVSLEVPMQFATFARFQRETYRGRERERLLDYWRQTLADAPELTLPQIKSRPKVQTFEGRMVRRVLPKRLYKDLRALARSENASLFMTMLAAFIALLYRYTGEEDAVVGSWFGNRHWPGSESVIGMLVNSVMLRTRVESPMTFSELVAAVRTVVTEAYIFQAAPFDDVVRSLNRPPDLSRNPIAQIFFSFHDSPLARFNWPGLTGEIVERSNGTAKFDLNVIVVPQGEQRGVEWLGECDELAILWEHNTDVLPATEVQALAEAYEAVLVDVVQAPSKTLSEITAMPAATRDMVLREWNETGSRLTSLSAVELFERVAEKHPDDVALEWLDDQFSYSELRGKSHRIALQLISSGVRPGDLVGIQLPRTPRLVAALLGVMQAGATFVPLDPTYPRERRLFMMQHSQASHLMTTAELSEDCPGAGVNVVILDDDDIRGPISGDLPGSRFDDLAYVIYTSGTTGRPKGVAVPHSALTNLLLAVAERPGLNADDVLMAVTTYSFDIAYLELFLPLVVGATVVLASAETIVDGDRLAGEIHARGVTIMQATPVTWRLLVESGWRGKADLRILVGGEVFPPELAPQLLARGSEVWNMYGPTETTIWSTAHRLEDDETRIPIGRPLANTSTYIVDPQLMPVPLGGVGELCIGGQGLAAGYHLESEMTHERFVQAPFASVQRLYRTGDLCRYRMDGTIEHLGRSDRQLKIRGFRIEPSEIEQVLAQHPSVREVLVVPRSNETLGSLVAYVVSDRADLDTEELDCLARAQLPEYMIPSVIELLAGFPRMPNGKIDHGRLPEPRAAQTAADDEPPTGDIERELARIWAGLLELPEIYRGSDFFALGGHSLLALRLVSRLRIDIGVELPVRVVYEYPTVARMAALIEATGDPLLQGRMQSNAPDKA